MSSIYRVPARISEIDRALKAMGFRLIEGPRGKHPKYKHPMARTALVVPGTPRSPSETKKRVLSAARKILREAGAIQREPSMKSESRCAVSVASETLLPPSPPHTEG